MNWMLAGLCAQTDPAAFFPKRGESPADAKRVCGACPVKEHCLDYALTTQQQHGVWGGLTVAERERLRNGTPASAARRDYTEVDRLLYAGEHTDIEIGELCNVPKSSVYRRRERLELLPLGQRRTPEAVYAELSRATTDGHREWIGGSHTAVQGRYYSARRLAFLAGHGREPEGHVRPTCGRRDCIASAHLADRTLRAGRVPV